MSVTGSIKGASISGVDTSPNRGPNNSNGLWDVAKVVCDAFTEATKTKEAKGVWVAFVDSCAKKEVAVQNKKEKLG